MDRLWLALQHQLSIAGFDDLPAALSQPKNYETAWLDADFLLAQTCGYPLRHVLDGKVRYVGTPIYDVEGTEGPYYRSALVVRANDSAETLEQLRGRRAAFNSGHSQSGYNALRDAASALAENGRFFGSAVATGSHSASLRAVLAGEADIAAIDPVSLTLQPDHIRDAIKIIGRTAATPGLPLITAITTSDDELASLRDVLGGFLSGAARTEHLDFHFAGFEVLAEEAYGSILAMEKRAMDRSYPQLA